MSDNNFTINWTAIVLAAGSSSRMGQAKQLISIAGETLLEKIITTAVQAGATKTVVVVGANHQAVSSIQKPNVAEFVHNPQWENGMGSSLKCGLNHVITQFPETEAALFLVCDQPLLDASHLKKMLEKFHPTQSPIVASFYSGGNGVPVLFHKSLFGPLLTIDDRQGAKKIIELNPVLVKSVDFPNGAVDLDTPEDLKEFQNRKDGI
jgi:molybdenum cofactor cytidylyltransferase